MATATRRSMGQWLAAGGVNAAASIFALAGQEEAPMAANSANLPSVGGNGEGLAPLPPITDLLTHQLKRTSFGIDDESYQLAQAMGWPSYLARQLQPSSIDDGAVEAAVAQAYPLVNATIEALLALPNSQRFQAAGQLVAATLYRARYSQRQLFEVMVDFWSNHFSIFLRDGPVALFKVIDDREVVRPHALGYFADLLHASAKSPAMLYYLDNYANVKDGPNENYARELLELHTLGEAAGYTQQDVEAVARCFTGWTIQPSQGTFVFNPRAHDQGEKVVLGEVIPAGGGVEDGERVLDLLARHPATASRIATKLCQRFISETPTSALVERIAAVFSQSGGHIPTLLEALFAEPEFSAAVDAKFRRPMDFMVAALRATDAATGPNFGAARQFLEAADHLPFNWPAPNGYPDALGYWANSNGLLNRWNFAFGLSASAQISLRALIGDAATPVEIVAQLSAKLLHRPLLDEDFQRLVEYLASAEGTMVAKLQSTVGLLLASPYFQRY